MSGLLSFLKWSNFGLEIIKAGGGGIQTASKDMTKLEEMVLNAAKPHDYDPAEKQVFQNGYVKGANAMLEAIGEIIDRNKQAYKYNKEYYINIDVFKKRVEDLRNNKKPAVSKEAPEKVFQDGYMKGANAILDEIEEIIDRNKQAYRYNKEYYGNIDVFTQRIDELKDKKPAISEETPEKALKPDYRLSEELQARFDAFEEKHGEELDSLTDSDLKAIHKRLENKCVCRALDKGDTDIESERIHAAKAKLFASIIKASKDMGKELSINPTTVVYNNHKDVVCKIYVDVDNQNDELLIGGVNEAGNEIPAYDMGEVLDDVDNLRSLNDSVLEAHLQCLLTKKPGESSAQFEQEAKRAIYSRITNSWQRSFTPDQVESLKRYHEAAAPDTPASEVFSRLLNEVAQEPDVARKPEKWVTDTLKELNDLAEGIARDQERCMHL